MKKSNIWLVSLKTAMMSGFATIIAFMLNCLIVTIASQNFFASDAVGTRIVMQIVGILVELIFIYGVLWDIGHNDKMLINLGQKNFSKYRGLLIGLISAIPYYLMAIAMMLMTFDLIPDITGLMRVLSSQFWGIYTFLFPVATSAGAVENPGFAQSIATPAQAICACFVPTIIPLLAHLPYTMGRKGIAVGERLMYSMKKK